MITLKEAEEAYLRLSMIHSETMLDNAEQDVFGRKVKKSPVGGLGKDRGNG